MRKFPYPMLAKRSECGHIFEILIFFVRKNKVGSGSFYITDRCGSNAVPNSSG